MIYLEDKMPTLTDQAAQWAKCAQAEDAHVYGWYAPSKADTSAYILLYVREIYRAVPSFLWWSTIPALRITRSLAHEVAHHLIATKRYEFGSVDHIDDEELLANRYADSVVQRMAKRCFYRLGQWGIKEIANWHYAFGSADWRQRKYRSAAERFFNAWDLDPQNEAACYWYWRAKQMSSAEKVTINS